MRLWKLLEKECHQLDLELAQLTRGKEGDRAEFLLYGSRVKKISQLEEEKARKLDYANGIDSACTTIALQLGERAQQSHLVSNLRQEAIRAQESAEQTVR